MTPGSRQRRWGLVMAAPSGCRNRTPVPSRGPEPCSPPLPLQNGSTKGLEQEAEAPALCLRLLCPQILVPALIGKVRARPAAALAGAACRLNMRRPMSSQARQAPRTAQFKACEAEGGNQHEPLGGWVGGWVDEHTLAT